MDTDRFWQIVDTAQRMAGPDTEARVDALRHLLSIETLEELQSFQSHYDEQIRRSYTWSCWAAAYIINGGASDDGFRYFRDWLISEGRAVFEAAIENPDSLAKLPRIDYAELELFGYVSRELFESAGGGEIERDFSTELTMPIGNEWSEDELPTLLPKLFAAYQ